MNSSVSARFNAELLEEKYTQWAQDPESVEESFRLFFDGFALGAAQTGPVEAPAERKTAVRPASVSAPGADSEFLGLVVSLIYNFRTLGHTQAHINPLEENPPKQPRLALDQYGISEKDMDRVVQTPLFKNNEKMTLREMIASLEEIYCGPIGFEFMHIHNMEVRHWLRSKIEARPEQTKEGDSKKRQALEWLLEAQLFEKFVGKKFLGEKRFSLEGGEGTQVLLQQILQDCPSSGVDEIEMGMAHRGRLNVLANFVKKSLATILYEFTPNYVPDLVAGDGDVKYHLGYESVREVEDGKVRVSLAANPSHLEAVNPVVEGKARARQRIIGDDGETTNRTRVLPLLLHGDASFAGQGLVAEVLNLSQLPGYRTGGTIHIIINNQIGFTTMPADARSSAYSSDVAKMIEAPILHVNGEKPMDLVWAAKLALEFREKFGRDVVIDMYCYRRQGHNENDQAAFTQPHIAKQIKGRLPIDQLYKKELVGEGVLSQEEADGLENGIWDRFEAEFERMQRLNESGDRTAFSGSTATAQEEYHHTPVDTGISEDTFALVGRALTTIPDDFKLHPTLAKRFIPRRQEALEKREDFDWAFAESLAFGSLLAEGYPVRLSGQDCRRGTFSQRHAVFYDNETRERYIPLRHVVNNQAKFCVYNSFLSEAAVLGFDYGYSLGHPNMLILWEAQFGDFSNGAQVIIDQFISSAESKWQTPSSVVMLLPHGYEGMGPEHSSARLERYLQLCAEGNMIVGNLTTPAQYFHALRRQKKRNFLKPLILMTPKSLLTKPEAVSDESEFLEGTAFKEMLDDPSKDLKAEEVTRIIFCTGKVYYDLQDYRQKNEISNVAIVRIEQLSPFHEEMLDGIVAGYPNLSKYVWCQEEPQNMGAWTYIRPLIKARVGHQVRYAGRDEASSPSTGSKAVHKREQAALVEEAFSV